MELVAWPLKQIAIYIHYQELMMQLKQHFVTVFQIQDQLNAHLSLEEATV